MKAIKSSEHKEFKKALEKGIEDLYNFLCIEHVESGGNDYCTVPSPLLRKLIRLAIKKAEK